MHGAHFSQGPNPSLCPGACPLSCPYFLLFGHLRPGSWVMGAAPGVGVGVDILYSPMLDSSLPNPAGTRERGSLLHSQEVSTYLNFLLPLSSPHTHAFRFVEQPTSGHPTQMHSSTHMQTRSMCPVNTHTLTCQVSLCYIHHTHAHTHTYAHTHAINRHVSQRHIPGHV